MRRPRNTRANRITFFPTWSIIAMIVGTVVVVTFLILALTINPLKPNTFELVTITSSTTDSGGGSTSSSSSATSSSSSSSTMTSSPSNTTTSPVTTAPVPYINITCPSNISIALGLSLDNFTNTGGNAIANSSCGNAVISHTDVVVDTFLDESELKRKRMRYSLDERFSKQSRTLRDQQGEHVDVMLVGEVEPYRKRFKNMWVRSPSYNSSNLNVIEPHVELNDIGMNSNSAANSFQVVASINVTGFGTRYYVYDANLTAVLANFEIYSMVSGSCNMTIGGGTINWDNDAQRWILMEKTVGNVLCMHVSQGHDILMGNIITYELNLTVPHNIPKLGIWANVYGVTVAGNNQCVLDRVAVLASDPFPRFFCAQSSLGLLAGFSNGSQSWTPINVEGDALLPPKSIESSNTGPNSIGAVFMRHHDDELHNNASTPLYDWIDVEHWTMINFDNATYQTTIYQAIIDDFDSSSRNCSAGANACIDTPNATVKYNPVRETIMTRLVYRDGSAYGAFVSHANGLNVSQIRWFELIWGKLTPSSAERFIPRQNGAIPSPAAAGDGIARWLPSIAVDASGTVVVVYSAASSILYPSMRASSRLANDPLSGMRSEIVVEDGATQSATWGRFQTVSTRPGTVRTFYFSGQCNQKHNTYRLIIQGELLRRNFTAQDPCGSAPVSCIQYIRTS